MAIPALPPTDTFPCRRESSEGAAASFCSLGASWLRNRPEWPKQGERARAAGLSAALRGQASLGGQLAGTEAQGEASRKPEVR